SAILCDRISSPVARRTTNTPAAIREPFASRSPASSNGTSIAASAELGKKRRRRRADRQARVMGNLVRRQVTGDDEERTKATPARGDGNESLRESEARSSLSLNARR